MIHDSGYGLEKEDLEHIFDRLYRSAQSRQRDKGGTGLGLALAKMIMEQHSGKIHAESEPGHGTRMMITLLVAIRNSRKKTNCLLAEAGRFWSNTKTREPLVLTKTLRGAWGDILCLSF